MDRQRRKRTPRGTLSPFFNGERARVRGGYIPQRTRLPLTPTLSP